MDDSVHNGICLCSATEPAMPFTDRILSGKDGGIIPAALFKQLIEVLGIPFGKFIIKPLIKDKNLIAADPFPVFCQFPKIVALVFEVAHQAGPCKPVCTLPHQGHMQGKSFPYRPVP